MCASPLKSTDAGYKLVCSNNACDSRKSVQNLCYPRTDPVAIVLIQSSDGHSALLGRSKRFKDGLYSCIAGFIEPGETVEEACCREAKEETNVAVNPENVVYHSSQPWPYPSQLMMGCIATAHSSEIVLNDGELVDAKWFKKDEIRLALDGNSDLLSLPPSTAIAHQLIKSWLES